MVHPNTPPNILSNPANGRFCPTNNVTLDATGCVSGVEWRANNVVLASTANSITISYAQYTGNVIITAKCRGNACQPTSAPMTLTRVEDCNALTCDFYIQATNATGQETTRLSRLSSGGNIYHPLTLKVLNLDGTAPTDLTYSWTGPSPLTRGTRPMYSATQVGEYKVTISAAGQTGTCELYTSLSSTPCNTPNSPPACGPPANITLNNPNGPYLPALAPGDQFTANDFVVTVTSVTSSPAGGGQEGVGFSGTGYTTVKLPTGQTVQVAVDFGLQNAPTTTPPIEAIKLDECYQLVHGSVRTQYDPSWGNILNVDDVVKALHDIKEQLSILLTNFRGTPEQIALIQNTLLPALDPHKDDPRVQEAITKIQALTTICKDQPTTGDLTPACKAAVAAAETAYNGLAEFIDDLPPFPSILMPGTLPTSAGRLAADGLPDITITNLDQCALVKCNRTNDPTDDPVRRYWGQIHGPGYEFWSVANPTTNQKFYILRTIENLDEETYYYVPYGGNRWQVFYPDRGKTSAEAFADAGQRFVFDVGLILATGGASSLSEVIVANTADAFITALEESDGDINKFTRSLATNMAFGSLDVLETAGPIFKNLLNKYQPRWSTFTQAARNKLDALRTQTGWLGQIDARRNAIPSKLLPNYGKVVKGALSAAFRGFSQLGATIDHKNKRIIDAGNKVIATFNQKAIKFTESVVPAGWTKKQTLYDVEVEEVVNGVPTRRKVDVEVYGGTCANSPNPNKRVAATDECLQCKKAIRALNSFNDWKSYVLDRPLFRGRLLANAQSFQLASQYWNNRHLYPNHPAFNGVSTFDDFYNTKFLTTTHFQAHHVLPWNVLNKSEKLQRLLHWGFENNNNFDFVGDENGVMMLAYVKNINTGHHGYAPNYDSQIERYINGIVDSYEDSWSTQRKKDAIDAIKSYISCVKRESVRICGTANSQHVNGNPLNSLTINCR